MPKKLTHSSTHYRLVKKLKSEGETDKQKLKSDNVGTSVLPVSKEQTLPFESEPVPGPSRMTEIQRQAPVMQQSNTQSDEVDFPGDFPCEMNDEDEFTLAYEEAHTVEQVEQKISLRNRLRQWANERQVHHTAVDELLSILRQNGHNDLPKDSRTLLKTPANVTIRKMGNGEFWYNGIQKNLLRVLEDMPSCPEKISLIFNVDGIAPFDSSPKQFWPILFLIHELRQFQPMVAAVYYGETKPPLNDFFHEFVNDMNAIVEQGLDIGAKHINVTIRCFVCDTPARSFIKGTPGSNAENGSCIKCTVVGEYDRKGRHMSYPRIHCPLRTDETFRNKIDEDHHKEDTPLTGLPINMVEDFIVGDSLHLIDLGIVRRCLYGWREGSYNFKTKLSKHQSDMISELLEGANKTKPYEIQRAIRPLKNLKFWKGSEYRVFLFYLGPVFLKDFLPPETYIHFLQLSCAITIMSCNYYLKYIGIAETLIEEYIEKFIEIYGIDSISSNVHNLIHVANDVKKFGILPSFSAYVFENKLGQLKSLVRHGNLPLSQVAKRSEEMSFVNEKADTENEMNISLKCKVAEKHDIERCEGAYKQVRFGNDFVLSADGKNNYFLTDKSEIISFLNATILDKKIYMYGQKIQSPENFFIEPFPSSQLNIFMTKTDAHTKAPPELYAAENIKCKMFIVNNNKNQSVFFPLIHTLDIKLGKIN